MTEFEQLAWGGGLLEGPRCDADGRVYFSDVMGGGVRRWSEGAREAEEIVPKRKGVGGIALHCDGGLVVSGRDVAHVTAGGETRVLLGAHPGVAGFNDLLADDDGTVLVGALRFRPFAGESPVDGEVWRIESEGEGEELFGPVTWPNGIGVLPDGAIVVSDYAHDTVLVWDRVPGAPATPYVSVPGGCQCDGLAVDAEGGLWIALGSGGGVGRVDPDGVFVGVIDVPATFVTSVSFGGADGRDLFVTTADNTAEPKRGGTLWRGRSEVPGRAVPLAVG